jgi:hypothetical protein
MQSDINISLAQTVWILGGISAIWAFLKWALTPLKKVEDHEKRISVLEQSTDERRRTDQFMMKSMNAIVNHLIDGNGVDQLKRVRDEYQNEIIKHHE